MRTTSVKGSEQSGVQPSPVASGLNQPTQVREPIVASGSRQQPPQWAAHKFKVDVGGHRVAATRKYRDVQANGRRAIVVDRLPSRLPNDDRVRVSQPPGVR
jgi:hypothetical protein